MEASRSNLSSGEGLFEQDFVAWLKSDEPLSGDLPAEQEQDKTSSLIHAGGFLPDIDIEVAETPRFEPTESIEDLPQFTLSPGMTLPQVHGTHKYGISNNLRSILIVSTFGNDQTIAIKGWPHVERYIFTPTEWDKLDEAVGRNTRQGFQSVTTETDDYLLAITQSSIGDREMSSRQMYTVWCKQGITESVVHIVERLGLL